MWDNIYSVSAQKLSQKPSPKKAQPKKPNPNKVATTEIWTKEKNILFMEYIVVLYLAD